jgi:cytokinin dehydrogenase
MQLNRRGWMKSMGALAVLAFDPGTRRWITTADAAPGGGGAISIPRLDGELLVDSASRAAVADDFGHLVQRTPVAVLRPGSVRDIQRVVEFANRHRLQVAMRGQGHSRFGQAQVEGGIVIDSSTLAAVQPVSGDTVVAEAGATWSAVVRSAVASGLTVPVVNNFMHLSVGGTLSVGGFGGASYRVGMQIDNVEQLEVVTGEGDLVTCSRFRHRDLFEAALGGIGQCGLIVRARLSLGPAPARARRYVLTYVDLAAFLADQRRLVGEHRFDESSGQGVLTPAGWRFIIEGVAFYTAPGALDDAALLAGLGFVAQTIDDNDYLTWAHRLDPGVAAQKASGSWFKPHPWFDIFLPASTADAFITETLAGLTAADLGGGPVPMFPFAPQPDTSPFMVLPPEPLVYVFGLFRLAADAAAAAPMVAANRALYERAVTAGAKMYPIDAIPLTRADWVAHYGRQWSTVQRRKQRFDPKHVLTPGQGVF